MRPRHLAALAAISLIWSILALTRPQEITAHAQLLASALSYLIAAVMLAVAALIFRIKFPDRDTFLLNAVLGITLIAAPHLLSLWAAPQVSPGLAFILFAATPLMTAFFCDAPWSARNIGVAGIAGVTLIAADTASTSFDQWPGVAALLLGLVATAASIVYAKKRIAHTHPMLAAATQLFSAGLILLTVAVLSNRTAPISSPREIHWPLILASAAAACVAYPLYYWLLRAVRPDQVASIVWAQFVLSVIGSLLLYRIHPQWRTIAGLLIVLASLVALARSQLENKLLTLRVTPLSR